MFTVLLTCHMKFCYDVKKKVIFIENYLTHLIIPVTFFFKKITNIESFKSYIDRENFRLPMLIVKLNKYK